MKKLIKLFSYTGLVLTIAPAFLAFSGYLDDASYKTIMLIGTTIWFVTAPFWIFKKKLHA